MESEEKKKSPLTSLLPVMLVGLVTIIAMNYFTGSDKKKDKKPGPPVTKQKKQARKNLRKIDPNLSDFRFRKLRGVSNETEIDTGAFYIVLTNEGGRIKRLYVKVHDELLLPDSVIKRMDDDLGKKEHAIEVTRYNGMDFQPHLYWRDNYGSLRQLTNPPLNHARFRGGNIVRDPESKIQQVSYRTNITFRGHRFELKKIYRFYEKEHFFRNVTIIRNLESRPFSFSFTAPVYFKPYGDIGPLKEVSNSRMPSNRFYFYGGELYQRGIGSSSGGGCSGAGLGCGADDGNKVVILGKPDSLEFVGSTSRYFFSYAKFSSITSDRRNRPDGLIISNRKESKGRESSSLIFSDFRLAARQKGGILTSDSMTGNFRQKLENLQQSRRDAYIFDSQVYLGVRSDEAHAYKNPEAMKKEFGQENPDSNARNALFSSSYFKLFSPIKDMIIVLMRWVNKYIGNYGWTIIIIAIGVKLATFPLSNIQAKSMKKMTAIKPEIEKINKLYADNPQEKQKKTMEIYKKHKINPAKGCLPLLIQMPIFVALFSAFSEAIELWHSPFIWWMTDLSQPDTLFVFKNLYFAQNVPLNILPILMAGSQILYQRFTTVTSDPQQKALMYLMPLIFVFIFWSMPSGVTLYWTVQNVFSIFWQIGVNKLTKDDDLVTT